MQLVKRALLPLSVVAALTSTGCPDEELAGIPGVVNGRACDDVTGAPLPAGTTIELHKNGNIERASTDGDGNYEFPTVSPGPITLVFPSSQSESRAVERVLQPAQSLTVEDLACRGAPGVGGVGDIEGQICNRHTGDLVRLAIVTVELPQGGRLTTSTNDDGEFTMSDVPAGEHVLTVSAPGFVRSFLVTVAAEAVFVLDAAEDCVGTGLDQGALLGRVCVPNAQVRAIDAQGNESVDISDAAGEFFLAGLAPGPAVVEIAASAFGQRFFDVTVVAGAEVSVLDEGTCPPDVISEGEGEGEGVVGEGEGEGDGPSPPNPPNPPGPPNPNPPFDGECVDGQFPPGTFGTEFECYGFSVADDNVYHLDRVNNVAVPICQAPGGLGPIEAFAVNPLTGNSYIVAQDTSDFGKFIPRSGVDVCIYTPMGNVPSSSIGGFGFSPDGVLYMGEEGSGTVWRFAQDANGDPTLPVTEIGSLPNSSEGLAFHPDTGLAYNSDGSTIHVVDIDNPGASLFSCDIGDSGFESIFFTQDGRMFSTNNSTNFFVELFVDIAGGGCSFTNQFTAAPELEGSDCNIGGTFDSNVCQ